MRYNISMEKYLVSFDLDGTLLNKKEKIPFFAKLAISRLLKNKHEVLLNTGRSIGGVIPFLKELNLYNYPISCNNGACIYYINRKSEITKTIYKEVPLKITNSFLNKHKNILDFVVIFALKDKYYYKPEAVPDFLKNKNDKSTIHNIEEFNINEPIIMFTFSVKKELKQIIDKLLEKEKKFDAFYWGDDDTYSYYDVAAPKTSKGYVMLEVADILKVKRENTIAYGDEINDISMLQMAKYGYFVLAKTSLKLKEKYDFPITKKESDKLGAIAHLYKNHKYLF